MPSLKFILQSKKNPSNIYARLILPDRDIKRKTGLFIDPSKWNKKRGMPKHPGQTYIKLSDMAKTIWDALETTSNPNGEWLETIINGGKTMFSNIMDIYIEEAPNIRNAKGGAGLSHNRVKNMKSFKKLVLKYMDIGISQIGKDYGEGLLKWMGNYSNNYRAKTIENLKTIVRFAKTKGYAIDESIFDVKVYWEQSKPVILTLEELDHIKTLELGERLSNVRKWLLLGCYTGQRVGDLFSIKECDTRELDGNKIIELSQQKTGKKVVIPLIPDAIEVIEEFPRPISVQKFNKYLSELIDKAKIDKKITSHCMRRSFSTNYYGKIPTPLIMKITGHSRESLLLKYIGKSEYDSALEFLSYFESGKK